MQATIALFTDGTVAVEVSLSLALIQWPFLTDISLAWAAASIFDPLSAEAGTDPSTAAATTAAESILRNSELAPWLYFNCILRDSQLFVPVADPVRPPVPICWSRVMPQMDWMLPNSGGGVHVTKCVTVTCGNQTYLRSRLQGFW